MSSHAGEKLRDLAKQLDELAHAEALGTIVFSVKARPLMRDVADDLNALADDADARGWD